MWRTIAEATSSLARRARSGCLVGLLVGCSSEVPVQPGPSFAPVLYGACGTGSACPSGTTCTPMRWTVSPRATCTVSCDTRGSCPAGGACGVGPDGTPTCFGACYQDSPPSFVCDAGRVVACEMAAESECSVCGCGDDSYCVAGLGCQVKKPLGANCANRKECDSGHCSTKSLKCVVAPGQPCTNANCDACAISNQGSYCVNYCNDSADCGAGACYEFSVFGFCHLSCDIRSTGQCPPGAQCLPTTGSGQTGKGYCGQ
jgi:hypothetical protein